MNGITRGHMKRSLMHIFFLAAIMLWAIADTASAQCPDPGVRVNQSTQVNREFYDNQVLAGCDPYCPDGEMDYCQNGGTRRGSPGSSGASVTTDVSKARMDCPPTQKMDTTCAVTYPACTGDPGGRSAGGSLSVCNKGLGLGTFNLWALLRGLFPGFYDGDEDGDGFEAFNACVTRMMYSIQFPDDVELPDGTVADGESSFFGDFTTNVTESGYSTPTAEPPCAGASVGVCGFRVNGSVCAVDETGTATDDAVAGESFVSVTSPEAVITFGAPESFMQGPVIVTGGGTMDVIDLLGTAAEITIAEGQIIATMTNSLLQVGTIIFEAGTSIESILDGTATTIVGTFYNDFDPADGISYGFTLELADSALVPIETIMAEEGALAEDDMYRIPVETSEIYLPPLLIPTPLDCSGEHYYDPGCGGYYDD